MELNKSQLQAVCHDKGPMMVLAGPGAGKTTVLNILGGMDSCTSGDVIVDGETVSSFSRKQLISYRRYDVGFVFQFYNLVNNLTAKENVELASQICRDPLPPEEVLKSVGLADRTDNFPSQLSGGEQQRVSIARALAKSEDAALRRADGRARLQHGKSRSETAPGHLQKDRHDGHRHNSQSGSDRDGGQGHKDQERKSRGYRNERLACRRYGSGMVTRGRENVHLFF